VANTYHHPFAGTEHRAGRRAARVRERASEEIRSGAGLNPDGRSVGASPAPGLSCLPDPCERRHSMIVVTGVGRSGTSMIAALYEELGFDTGGRWVESINAGLEDARVVEMNETLMAELNLFGAKRTLVPPAWKRTVKRHVSPDRLQQAREVLARGPHLPARGTLQLLDWDRMDEVVDKHGAKLRELSADRPVVKDPRFRYTLEVWLRAHADVSHVLLSLRELEAAMKSKVAAGYERDHAGPELRNWLVYGLGLCMDAVLTHRVPFDLVHFPDFLDRPEMLYAAMTFPDPVERSRFMAAFERVARPDMVHH
jgi:hypothetical protein